MARHRGVRNMDYNDEYDDYDDIYGHSVDDDYCISPSSRQFIYNREASRDLRFENTEDDIQEVDETEELSDTDKAKLNSCITQVKNTLGTVDISRPELVNLIIKHKFNMELIINAILEDPKGHEPNHEVKDKVEQQLLNGVKNVKPNFTIPKLFNSEVSHNFPMKTQNSFVIPKFGNAPQSGSSPTHFKIPKLFETKTSSPKFVIPKLNMAEISSKQDQEFNSLSELVSNHLKSSLQINDKSEVNNVGDKLAGVKLHDVRESKSCINNPTTNGFAIDLSRALKVTTSLPNLPKNTPPHRPEKFEIPFIDCEVRHRKLQSPQILPCVINSKSKLNVDNVKFKKVSKFGKVICTKYQYPKKIDIFKIIKFAPLRKKFLFDIMSPDDIVSFHLNKAKK